MKPKNKHIEGDKVASLAETLSYVDMDGRYKEDKKEVYISPNPSDPFAKYLYKSIAQDKELIKATTNPESIVPTFTYHSDDDYSESWSPTSASPPPYLPVKAPTPERPALSNEEISSILKAPITKTTIDTSAYGSYRSSVTTFLTDFGNKVVDCSKEIAPQVDICYDFDPIYCRLTFRVRFSGLTLMKQEDEGRLRNFVDTAPSYNTAVEMFTYDLLEEVRCGINAMVDKAFGKVDNKEEI